MLSVQCRLNPTRQLHYIFLYTLVLGKKKFGQISQRETVCQLSKKKEAPATSDEYGNLFTQNTNLTVSEREWNAVHFEYISSRFSRSLRELISAAFLAEISFKCTSCNTRWKENRLDPHIMNKDFLFLHRASNL